MILLQAPARCDVVPCPIRITIGDRAEPGLRPIVMAGRVPIGANLATPVASPSWWAQAHHPRLAVLIPPKAWMPGRSLCPGLSRVPGMTRWQRPRPISRYVSAYGAYPAMTGKQRTRRRTAAAPVSRPAGGNLLQWKNRLPLRSDAPPALASLYMTDYTVGNRGQAGAAHGPYGEGGMARQTSPGRHAVTLAALTQ